VQILCIWATLARRTARSSYFASGKSAKYCDQRVCMFVCMSVYLSALISKNHTRPNFTKFSMLHVAVARSFTDGSARCYVFVVFPVLWVTSCFHITDGIGIIKTARMFHPVRQVAEPAATAKSAVFDCILLQWYNGDERMNDAA